VKRILRMLFKSVIMYATSYGQGSFLYYYYYCYIMILVFMFIICYRKLEIIKNNGGKKILLFNKLFATLNIKIRFFSFPNY